MGRSVARNVASRLRPGSRPRAVRVNHAADLRKTVIKNQVGFCIRGRIQRSLNAVSFQIHDNHIIWRQFVIVHARRFDDKQPLLAVNPGNIAPGKGNQTVFRKQHISFVYFFF